MSRVLYARIDESVTCESCGTILGHFCKPVWCGDGVRPDDFLLANGEHPAPHSAMPRCGVCGGQGFRNAPGCQAHFVDGWRGGADAPIWKVAL